MSIFNRKQDQQPNPQTKPMDETLSGITLELAQLEARKKKMELEAQMAQQQASQGNIEDTEKLYIKTLSDVEALVRFCEEKSWLTKKDWDVNSIPMKQMVTDLLKITIKYSGLKIDELYKLMKEMRMDKDD